MENLKKYLTKRNIIIGSLVVLLVFGFFGFWRFRDAVFSKEIVRLEILGPENTRMGDEIEYTVKYKNNGNFALEQVKLIFQLPDNSLTEDSKTRLTQDLPDIYPGDEKFVKFKARLLGKENDVKAAHAMLSYMPHNLTARYESTTTFTTKLATVPINLEFDLQSRIEKNKEITYAINYFSNVDYPLENLSIKIEPVSGFDFKSSDPESLDNLEWKLATLEKNQGGRIKIKGLVLSDTGSSLNFSARLGMRLNGMFVPLKEATKEIAVIQPLLFVSQEINGSSNYVASPGETLQYQVFVRNIGSTAFTNAFAVVRLDGLAFDLSTLQSSQGQVRVNDSLVAFDGKQIQTLNVLSPQEEVTLAFSVKLKDSWPAGAQSNNTLAKNNVSVFDISQDFTAKVNSKLEVAQKAYHGNQGGFTNSGPVPPQVNVPTTYTIVWQVKNYFNDVKNVKVRAVLPQNVTLSDTISEDQLTHISFDSNSREMVWSVGDMAPGTGVNNAPVSLSFQVALTPNVTQRGTLAQLIGQANIMGEDQFTGSIVVGSASPVSSNLPDDPSNSGGGIVQ